MAEKMMLTDEQLDALFCEHMLYQDGVTPGGLKRITRIIEHALADQLAQARREMLDEVIECVRTVGGLFAEECERNIARMEVMRALGDEE